MWRRFTDTFDVYLMILRRVKMRIDTELGRLDPDWRLKNSCPPCQYKVSIIPSDTSITNFTRQLEDEPPLQISVMGAMDGNQSQKRVAMREELEEDPREFNSDYYIKEKDVDVFKNDVKPRPPKKKVCIAFHARVMYR
jgi:Kyakuja-Dileera-Zisupton transposase